LIGKMIKGKKDILVIDDEQVILGSISKIGTMEGLTIDTTDNGLNGLEKLVTTDYRLIVSDIMMPVMDGFTLLDELFSRNISTPVIMTTGYSTFENAVKSLYKGAIDFIAKPFTFDEITAVIQRSLKYSDIKREAQNSSPANGFIAYVPCPAKYFRIGYASWVNITSPASAEIGLTDLFNKTIDTIKKIELIETGELVTQANFAIKIETENEMVHQIYSPISGKITARNEKLFEDLSLIEKDPYFEGWIYKVEPTDIENEIKSLIPCCSDRI
jgi:CheY-like chemotaxis protein/glycine cleavage system H lipoate-binding protein